MAKIAIVDDSRLARLVTTSCVKNLGHELREIEPTSVFDVMERLREDPPALVLMDYLMPNCPGLSLARALREDPGLRYVKILMISAHRDEDIQLCLKRLGVESFMSKPFEAKTLVETVEGLLQPGW